MNQDDRWHEERIGTLARHDQIKFPQLVGDKLLCAYHSDEWFASFGDWRSRGWADITHLSMAEGHPLIIGKRYDKTVCVHWDGITGNAYADVPFACVSGGHLYHPAKLESGRWCVVVDHRPMDDTYAQILGLSAHDGHICLAVDDGKSHHVSDDGQRGQTWDLIWGHQMLDGRSLYTAKRDRSVYLVHGDRTIGPWQGIWNLKVFRGKALYTVLNGSRHEVYFGPCNWRSPAFVQEIACVNELPFFSVKVNGAWAVIYDNITEGGFRRIGKLFNNYSKPLYEATISEGRALFFGREMVTDACDEVLAAKPISGGVVSICRVGARHRVCVGTDEQRTYGVAFGLCQKKRRFEFGAIDGSDVVLATYRFR